MATPRRAVLGIEISPREIRMIEMRGGAGGPQIVRAGSVPLPAGAVDGDRIAQVEAVADMIQGLHRRLGCQAKAAVVGMGVQSVVTRILAIPRVPDSELRYVIEGELVHYQILRSGGGAFDFFRLDAASADEGLPSVLLMAAEERTAQGYRQALEKAGLHMLALEPITLSLFRAAYDPLSAEPAALCLAVTPQRTELSVLDHGQIRLYRRLDQGSDDFLQGRKAPASNLPGGRPKAFNLVGEEDTSELDYDLMQVYRPPQIRLADLTEEEDDTADLEEDEVRASPGPNLPPMDRRTQGTVIPQEAAALVNEVQRSLEYYRREFPNATAITRVILTTNDPEAAALSSWLSEALRVEVRVAQPPTDASLSRGTSSLLELPQGLRLLGAYGLGLHALTPDWKHVPRFNMAATGSSSAPPIERDRLAGVMVASLCVLIGGFFGGMLLSRNAQSENEMLNRQRQALGVKVQDYRMFSERVEAEKSLNAIIKSDNLPIPAILGEITRDVPASAGLTNVEIAQDGRITVEGDTKDVGEFTAYYFSLIQCPYFVTPRYQSIATDQRTGVTHFKIETSLVGTQAAASPRSL